MSAIWNYKAIYHCHDEQVRQRNDVVSVTVGGYGFYEIYLRNNLVYAFGGIDENTILPLRTSLTCSKWRDRFAAALMAGFPFDNLLVLLIAKP